MSKLPALLEHKPLVEAVSERRQGALVFPGTLGNQRFEQEIASIYADLAEKQKPLEREFAAVWDANIEQLYES